MSASNSPLFQPFSSKALALPNRFVMAPLTRSRAAAGAVPTPLHATYYAQRASAGLIISEGVWVSPEAEGWWGVPGIYSDEQVAAWRVVTDAVHAKGGQIAAQLWHTGSASHPDFFGGLAPLAPSAINPDYHSNTPTGKKPTVTPRAMTIDDIHATTQDFVKAARNSIKAGFDAVEIQGGYVYLFNQFLTPALNERTDEYGGSVENRARFLFEVIEAVGQAIGFEKVGVKTSPGLPPFAGDVGKFAASEYTIPTFDYVISRLNNYPLHHLLLMDAQGDLTNTPIASLANGGLFRRYREIYKGTIIANVGLDSDKAVQLLNENVIDLAAFGRAYIANSDLVERVRQAAPLNEVDWAHVYVGGEKGFTDYPVLAVPAASEGIQAQ